MSLTLFLPTVFALLAVPGPTNALVGLARAQAGAVYAGRLVPVVLAGYLTVIIPLAWFGHNSAAQDSLLSGMFKVCAATWILILCRKLWTSSAAAGSTGAMSFPRVYVTTLLNPKALVVGAAVLPPLDNPHFAPHLALFCLAAGIVTIGWGIGGALAGAAAGAGRRILTIQRVAAMWLAVVSGTLLASVVTS